MNYLIYFLNGSLFTRLKQRKFNKLLYDFINSCSSTPPNRLELRLLVTKLLEEYKFIMNGELIKSLTPRIDTEKMLKVLYPIFFKKLFTMSEEEVYSEEFPTYSSKPKILKLSRYDFIKNFVNSKHRTFHRFVNGKKVIILGPQSNVSYSKLSEYPIKIGVNPNYNDSRLNSSLQLYNLVYYSGEIIDSLKRNNIVFYSKDLYVVSRASKNEVANVFPNAIIRDIIYPPNFFPGEPFLLQTIIWDVLQFNPSEIFIDGFTLYTGEIGKWYPNTTLSYPKATENHLKSFAEHNLTSNFNFTRYLRKFPNVIFSNSMMKILDLNIQSYIMLVKKSLGI